MSSTVRIAKRDKQKLEELRGILSKTLGEKVSQEQTLKTIVGFSATRVHEVVGYTKGGIDQPDLAEDPFWDPSLVFDMGRTTPQSHNKILYMAKR